jgi:hypothetical protein
MSKLFTTEAELVSVFCDHVETDVYGDACQEKKWIAYHETSGWDLLMVEKATGIQVGIEAKLSLNVKVLNQALVGSTHYFRSTGPDYRAVLIPGDAVQQGLENIAGHIGLTVITASSRIDYRGKHSSWSIRPRLPDETQEWGYRDWFSWLPEERCPLPDYIPDVMGGKSSPVALTDWKIKAIKLMIILERRGYVTRADMNTLRLSPSRWTAAHYGFLIKGPVGYVRHGLTPDLKADHPVNWVQIEADIETWGKGIDLTPSSPLL